MPRTCPNYKHPLMESTAVARGHYEQWPPPTAGPVVALSDRQVRPSPSESVHGPPVAQYHISTGYRRRRAAQGRVCQPVQTSAGAGWTVTVQTAGCEIDNDRPRNFRVIDWSY